MLHVASWPGRFVRSAAASRTATLRGKGSSNKAWARASRIVLGVAIGLMLLLLLAELVARLQSAAQPVVANRGIDYRTYIDAARRWLSGGPFYEPYQLAGPYQIVSREILYPPIILPLLVPFTVLPAVLWWAIPLGVTSWLIADVRPSLWGWAAICALLILPLPFTSDFPWALGAVVSGNPVMWIVAALAAGTRWGWPSVLVILKPSLFPFALLGCRTRRWWIAAGALAAISAVLLPMWVQYVAVLLNTRGPSATWYYSIGEVPLMLTPLVAWLARRNAPAPRFKRVASLFATVRRPDPVRL